jgi:hypothetical protein
VDGSFGRRSVAIGRGDFAVEGTNSIAFEVVPREPERYQRHDSYVPALEFLMDDALVDSPESAERTNEASRSDDGKQH